MVKRKEVETVLKQQAATARITNATIYESLFQLERSITLRLLQLQEGVNGVNDRLNKHEERHTINERAMLHALEVEQSQKELKLTPKNAGIGAVLASLVVIIAAAIKELIGNSGQAAWW